MDCNLTTNGRTKRKAISAFLVVSGLLSTLGCGGGYEGPPLLEAGGLVTFKGQPVEDATVVFIPSDTSNGLRAMQVMTDSEGEFSLATLPEQSEEFLSGAPAGEYLVEISKRLQSPDGRRMPAKNLLPKRYAQAKQSGLMAKIQQDSENHFTFDLKK